MTSRKARGALDEFRRREVQGLFEKMADRHHGKVELLRWHRDGSATIAVADTGIGGTIMVRRRVSSYVNSGGIPLVTVSWGKVHVHMSPRATAVLAVILYG